VERLVKHGRLKQLWAGSDFALGHNREGDMAYLRVAGQKQGFDVRVREPVLIDGEVISSTRIRQTLRDGAVEQAARYLGRPFRLSGLVVEGAQRGRKLGIPTANVAVGEEMAVPAVGVYAAHAYHSGGPTPAVVNIGFRPTFEGGEARPVIEAHLLDFSGNLYHSALTLAFVARLRPEMKFPGIDALVAQIHRDIESARVILAQ
jgi:riboflavin kinase/FMN adenylyltransferase